MQKRNTFMMKYNTKKLPVPRGTYILNALEQHSLNGDAYILFDEAYDICCRDHTVVFKSFLDDLMFLIKNGDLLREGSRLYCTRIYRYEEAASAHLVQILTDNVMEFEKLHSTADMLFDESFSFMQMDDGAVVERLVEDAVRAYRIGENIQVLSPYNSCTMLSADKLNRAIRECVNPANPGKLELSTRFQTFRDGDRVIITKNDRDHDCSNGDVGILHITDTTHKDYPEYYVQLSDGRCPQWDTRDGLYILKHAYALTVHKSQGSEYDRILFPVSSNAMNMMYRNLFYTAISRGKKQVVLYGSKTALSVAMQREADVRKTILVVKTRSKQTMCA